jgi:hypothetical protein
MKDRSIIKPVSKQTIKILDKNVCDGLRYFQNIEEEYEREIELLQQQVENQKAAA